MLEGFYVKDFMFEVKDGVFGFKDGVFWVRKWSVFWGRSKKKKTTFGGLRGYFTNLISRNETF